MNAMALPQVRRLAMNSQTIMLATRNSGFMFQYPHGFKNTNTAYLHIPRERVE